MGRHAAPETETASAPPPTAQHFAPPAFAPPTLAPSAPQPSQKPADDAPRPTRPASPPSPPSLPTPPYGNRSGTPSTHDQFSAINLVIPRQQSLGPRALGWGIVSVLVNALFVPSIFAVVWGAMGVVRVRRLREAGVEARGRGTSVAGIVLGVIGFVIGLFWMGLFVTSLRR